jgi:hypothetical protein
VITHLALIYWLLLTLKDTAYAPGVYSALLGWAYQRDIHGFAWKMFCESASIADEECGELSFSILARFQLMSTSRSKLAQTCKTYSDLRTYVTASKQMRLGQHLSEFFTGGRNYQRRK